MLNPEENKFQHFIVKMQMLIDFTGWGGGGGGGGGKRVSVYVSECVFAVPIYFFSLWPLFWLMIFSLVSRCSCFGNAYGLVFVFVAVCFFLL